MKGMFFVRPKLWLYAQMCRDFLAEWVKKNTTYPKKFLGCGGQPIVNDTSGQSFKASTIVIYDSRVVPDLKIPHITTLEL